MFPLTLLKEVCGFHPYLCFLFRYVLTIHLVIIPKKMVAIILSYKDDFFSGEGGVEPKVGPKISSEFSTKS